MCDFIGDVVTDLIEYEIADVMHNLKFDELCDEISPLITHSSNIMYVWMRRWCNVWVNSFHFHTSIAVIQLLWIVCRNSLSISSHSSNVLYEWKYICDVVIELIMPKFTDRLHKLNYEDVCDVNLLPLHSLVVHNMCVNP